MVIKIDCFIAFIHAFKLRQDGLRQAFCKKILPEGRILEGMESATLLFRGLGQLTEACGCAWGK